MPYSEYQTLCNYPPKPSAVDLELDISSIRKDYNIDESMFCIFCGILKQHGVFTSTEVLNTLGWV